MKRMLIMVTLLALVVAGAFGVYSFAQSAAKDEVVNCCVQGKCKAVAKSVCLKAGGKVVKDCKDCGDKSGN